MENFKVNREYESAPYGGVVRSKDVIGKDVYSSAASDDKMGVVEDVVLNKYSGEVLYVVLNTNTGLKSLFTGKDLTALPWKALTYNLNKEAFVTDKTSLKEEYSFAKDKWPDFTSEQWNKGMQKSYSGIWGQDSPNSGSSMTQASGSKTSDRFQDLASGCSTTTGESTQSTTKTTHSTGKNDNTQHGYNRDNKNY